MLTMKVWVNPRQEVKVWQILQFILLSTKLYEGKGASHSIDRNELETYANGLVSGDLVL